MNGYRIVHLGSGRAVDVEAANEWSAVRKAAAVISGVSRVRGPVTWHGLHAECGGMRFARPYLMY